MHDVQAEPGQIIVLNGAPRSGKSSIAHAITGVFKGDWLNLGVDVWMEATPEPLRPGIGLRPGGERPDLEPAVLRLYRGLYRSIAACSRMGIGVAVDVGHHECYSSDLRILSNCAKEILGLPVLFVGVRCPTDVILQRRRVSGWKDESRVDLWEQEVHGRWKYDLELDTSRLSPIDCAEKVAARLKDEPIPDAFWRNAGLGS